MAAVTRLRCGSGHPTTLDGVRALLLEGIHPDAVSRLKADAYDVDVLGRALDEDAIAEAAEASAGPSRPMDNTDFSFLWRKQMTKRFVAAALRELAS